MKKLDTDDEIVEVVQHYQATLSLRATAEHFGVGKNTIARRLQDAKDRGLIDATTEQPRATVEDIKSGDERVVTSSGSIKTLGELIEYSGVNLDDWIVARHKVNKWDAQTRGGGVVELHQVTAWLERRPSFFVQRVEPVSVLRRKPSTSSPDTRITLIVPDSQHGFRRRENGTLEPLHDRRALDVVLQAATKLADDITDVVLLGDMLDLAPWSKYPTSPDLRFTTMPALRELFWFLTELRTACPSARLVYLCGNHEARIEKALVERADEALNLRPAARPDDRPVLSIPFLLSLDDLDIEWVAPYGRPYWLEGVRFQHGSLVRRRGGQTSTSYLAHATASGVWGHVHRLELAQRRIQTPEGAKTITAMSPGCLCRVDGVVPQAGGEPVDWQQGLGLMYASARSVSLQLVPILDGVGVVHGETLVGTDRLDDIREATGLDI